MNILKGNTLHIWIYKTTTFITLFDSKIPIVYYIFYLLKQGMYFILMTQVHNQNVNYTKYYMWRNGALQGTLHSVPWPINTWLQVTHFISSQRLFDYLSNWVVTVLMLFMSFSHSRQSVLNCVCSMSSSSKPVSDSLESGLLIAPNNYGAVISS